MACKLRLALAFLLFLIPASHAIGLNASFDQQICFNVTNSSPMVPVEMRNQYVLLNLTPFAANYSLDSYFVTIATNETGFAHVQWFGNMSRYQYINSTWEDCTSSSCYLHTMANLTNSTDSGGPASICVYIKNNTIATAELFQIWTTDLIHPYANYTGWEKGTSTTDSCTIDGTLGLITCPVASDYKTTGFIANTTMFDQHLTVSVGWTGNSGPFIAIEQNNSGCGRYGIVPRRYTDDQFHFLSSDCGSTTGTYGAASMNNIMRQERYNGTSAPTSVAINMMYINDTDLGIYNVVEPPYPYDPTTHTFVALGVFDGGGSVWRNFCSVSTLGEVHNFSAGSGGSNLFCQRANVSTTATLTNASVPAISISIISPKAQTYNTTAITFSFNASGPDPSYDCNYTLNGVTNATNITFTNASIYSVPWTLAYGSYALSITCSNTTNSFMAAVYFDSVQMLGWINSTHGSSFYNTSLNNTYCEAMINGNPLWVNFTVTYPNGTMVGNLNSANGTNLTATGNWISDNFTANVTGAFNCSASAFDGEDIITNETLFTVFGANAPLIFDMNTNRGLSFDFVGTNDTNISVNVLDPDGNSTIEWCNLTLTNPVGTPVISNLNGTFDGIGTWTYPNFIAGVVGIWPLSITCYDGVSMPTNSTVITVNTPAGGGGGGGGGPSGGGGGGTIIINGTTPETPFELPAVTGGEAFLQIVAIAGVILFILASQQK